MYKMNNKSQAKLLPIFFISLVLIGSFIYFVMAGSFDPEDTRPIGYEFLNLNGSVVPYANASVVHIWNNATIGDYYFNKSSGVQWSNHFEDYWTHNVFCLGYYNLGIWNKIACADELTNFEKSIETDNETYVNATLWKDISYGIYDLRMGLRYHLELEDENLTIIISGENIGIDIPFDLGFAWRVNDIQINSDEENDKIFINDTYYDLHSNETIDLTFTDLNESYYELSDVGFVRLDWNNNLNYKVKVQNGSDYNAHVTLGINVGTLDSGETKFTTLYWQDPPPDASFEELNVYQSSSEILGSGDLVCTIADIDDASGDTCGSDLADSTSYRFEVDVSEINSGNFDCDAVYFEDVVGSGDVLGTTPTITWCGWYDGGSYTEWATCSIVGADIQATGTAVNMDATTEEFIFVLTTDSDADDGTGTFFADGTDSETSDIITFTVGVADPDYPQFSNYWDDNASLEGTGIGHFNITVTSTNGTVWLEIDGENITATNYSSAPTIFNASHNFTTSGVYPYRWHSWGNGTNENYNGSIERSYTVNVSYGWLNVTISKPSDNSNWNEGYTNLTINATVTCEGDSGDICGNITALARYGSTTPDTAVNISEGGLPFTLYRDTNLLNGLPSFYKLNESSGNAIDSAGTNDGILIGGIIQGADGLIGTAYNFDGVGQDTVSTFTTPANGFVSMWVKFDSVSVGTYYFYNSGSANWNIMRIGYNGAGNPHFGLYDVSLYDITNTSMNFTAGRYYHIGAEWGTGGMKLYVDNELVGTNAYTGNGDLDQPMYIGCITTQANILNGTIDEVGVWNRSLTSDERGYNYNQHRGLTHPFEFKNLQTFTTLDYGDSWNIFWDLNVTSNSTESYEVDVLFNSSYGNTSVQENSTEDRTVNLNPAIDTTNPTYSLNQTNNTIVGKSTLFSIKYDDNSTLHPNGQYIFSTNNSGSWANESAVNFTATPNWANVTKTLNSTVGISIGYRWYADDNAGNINNTGIFTLTTTSVDTCSCPGAGNNWEISLADYCNITTNCNLSTGNLTFINEGYVLFNATLTTLKITWKDSVAVVEKYNLGSNFRGWIG